MPFLPPNQQRQGSLTDTLFCSLAVLDPRVGHTMDVLSPFIPVLCHFDSQFHGKSCPRLDVVRPGRAWSSSPACTWHCSLHYLFLQATPFTLLCEIFARACVRACVSAVAASESCSSRAVDSLSTLCRSRCPAVTSQHGRRRDTRAAAAACPVRSTTARTASPYSTAERRVQQLIPVLGSQPAGSESYVWTVM